MFANRPFPAATVVLALAATPLLSGCIARTAASIVTAPVRVVSQGADWATTSQSEADENRGRALRKREERLGQLERSYRRHSKQCSEGDQAACQRARQDYAAIDQLRPSVPAEFD